jgi:hypothetical protein
MFSEDCSPSGEGRLNTSRELLLVWFCREFAGVGSESEMHFRFRSSWIVTSS